MQLFFYVEKGRTVTSCGFFGRKACGLFAANRWKFRCALAVFVCPDVIYPYICAPICGLLVREGCAPVCAQFCSVMVLNTKAAVSTLGKSVLSVCMVKYTLRARLFLVSIAAFPFSIERCPLSSMRVTHAGPRLTCPSNWS